MSSTYIQTFINKTQKIISGVINSNLRVKYNAYVCIFENVPSHEETCEKLKMFPEIVCVSLITQQILTAIIPLFHFSHHHHPGGLLESLQWMCARLLNCSALNEIVISVVVISVGDMNHCPSVLTSSHPAPGCRQPSHANSLIHRVQFSPSNKASG